MNTPNNRRRRESKQKMESVFIEMLKKREVNQISVTDICKAADVNRSTFYANYIDIYDLAESVLKSCEEKVFGLYAEEMEQRRHSFDFLKLFRHIKENPGMYKTYFKLNTGKGFRMLMYDPEAASARFDLKHVEYHMEFFGNGLNGIIKKWLENDCRESPEEMAEILREEYRPLSEFFANLAD